MVRSRTIEEYKQRLSLTDPQREALVGILLGDGCLETANGGRTYRLKIEQSAYHKAYVLHLYELFREWVLTPPRQREVVSGEHTSENWLFQTVSHGAFRFYAQQFYTNDKKGVPKLINHWLTPRGLAYWFMDDGSIKSKESKGLILNTQGFYRSDIERLCTVLQTLFGLEAQTRNQKDGCQVYISGNSYERFVELTSSYIIEEMRYKVPPTRLTHLPKE